MESQCKHSTHYPINSYRDYHLKSAYKSDDELTKIYHLTESHSPVFRYNATCLYEKHSNQREWVPSMIKDYFTFKCQTSSEAEELSELLHKVEEMPPEWTIVQLTSHLTINCMLGLERKITTPIIDLTIFNCGQEKEPPIHLTIEAPVDHTGKEINLLGELNDIVVKNSEQHKIVKLDRQNPIKVKKINMLVKDLRSRMKNMITDVENYWLQSFVVLMLGKLMDKEVEKLIDQKADELINMFNLSKDVKSKILLKQLIKGVHHLKRQHMNHALQHLVPSLQKSDYIQFVNLMKLPEAANPLRNKTNPVILIVDDRLDAVPWEIVTPLNNQSISRMQSFHFIYALFKEYQDDIVDGWKMVKMPIEVGTILNPSKDLMRMETRLNGFYRHCYPEWKGIVGRAPTSEEFANYLKTVNVFIYDGHNDGFQYLDKSEFSKLHISAVILLFGCGSVKLSAVLPQAESYGSYQKYQTACSPCVVGMLWPVTDRDTSFLSTTFISYWIPSSASPHWSQFELDDWLRGDEATADVKKLPLKKVVRQFKNEPDLLSALRKAKTNSSNILVYAACVARGIPVKLDY